MKPKPTYAESRAAREHIRVQRDRLRLRKELGELIKVKAVQQQAFAVGRRVRDSLLNIPDRLAGVIAAEGDQHAVHAILRREIHQALEALAGGAHA